MDRIQSLLFGKFPRAVGVTTPNWDDTELKQFLVHSGTEFDGVMENALGEQNLYSSISAFKPVDNDGEYDGNAVLADKVSFDFDSSAKLSEEEKSEYGPDEETPNWSHPQIPEFASDAKVIEGMRKDEDIRQAVLGDVCNNVRRLAQEMNGEGVPIVGVFSGFGIHVHMLHQETMSRPSDKMASICRKWTVELNLACSDERASGRPFRIMRVPNVERICHATDTQTGLYTIPLTASELAEIDPTELMTLSHSPRRSIGLERRSRPEMKVQEDYLGPKYEDGDVGQEKMRPVPDTEDQGVAEALIKKYTRMPCVYERAIGRNPPNDVRVKLGIMLLNAGLSPSEATDLIAKLGWVDFDRSTTKYQLEKLRESGKGDWSCRTMQAKGLCTRADDKLECPTYGYQGGNDPKTS